MHISSKNQDQYYFSGFQKHCSDEPTIMRHAAKSLDDKMMPGSSLKPTESAERGCRCSFIKKEKIWSNFLREAVNQRKPLTWVQNESQTFGPQLLSPGALMIFWGQSENWRVLQFKSFKYQVCGGSTRFWFQAYSCSISEIRTTRCNQTSQKRFKPLRNSCPTFHTNFKLHCVDFSESIKYPWQSLDTRHRVWDSCTTLLVGYIPIKHIL